jgi:hypothetical protein
MKAARFQVSAGTDLHEYLEGPIFTPAEAPHPLTGG